jgi:hypothetical protein
MAKPGRERLNADGDRALIERGEDIDGRLDGQRHMTRRRDGHDVVGGELTRPQTQAKPRVQRECVLALVRGLVRREILGWREVLEMHADGGDAGDCRELVAL